MIIAIDVYSATGKSSISEIIADKNGFQHINSGFIYRLISLFLLNRIITKCNYHQNVRVIETLVSDFTFDYSTIKKNKDKLRQKEVSDLGVLIAQLPVIRTIVNNYLRHVCEKSNCVVDGRDIGSEIFPNAELKFFLTADIDVRANRICNERRCFEFEKIKNEILQRDAFDEKRVISPLRRAEDAIEIDTSELTILELIEQMQKFIDEINR